MSTPVRFTRPREDRIAGGVCTGLARELRVDVTVVRAAAVVLAIFGIGLVLYAALMLVVPEEGQADPLAKRALDGQDRPLVAVLLLVCIVGVASFDGPFGWLDGDGWPIALVAIATAAVAVGYRRRDADEAAAAAVPPAAPLAGAPNVAEVGPEPDTSDVRIAEEIVGAEPAAGEEPTLVAHAGAVPPRAPRQHAGAAAALTLGIALLTFAIAGGVIVLFGLEPGWDVVLACGVVLVGVLLLLAAPFGGARALVPLGLALAAVAGVAAAADLELEGGVGERTYRPTTLAQVDEPFELSAGRLELDLRDLPLAPGGTPVEVQLGFGELVVRVPDDAPVRVQARAAGGDLNVLGRDQNGLDVETDVEERGRGAATSARLDLDAQVGFGEITVVRGDQSVDDARRSAGLAHVGAWR